MVPAYAVGRSQAILHTVYQLIDGGELPEVPVYLNSPMAIDVTKLYVRYEAYHRLSIEECRQAFGRVRLVRSVDESKALNRRSGPFIVVAGAGMLSGGRILHHLRAFGGDRRNTILLTGYQAPGTRGAALLRGDDSLKIHGRQIPIRCEVAKLDGLSAHADRRGLLEWLEAMDGRPRGICLVHGEEPAASVSYTEKSRPSNRSPPWSRNPGSRPESPTTGRRSSWWDKVLVPGRIGPRVPYASALSRIQLATGGRNARPSSVQPTIWGSQAGCQSSSSKPAMPDSPLHQ